MSKQDKYKEKIEKLNKAWKLMNKALKMIKEAFPRDKDIDYYLYKLNKANDLLQSNIYKKLENFYVNEEWKKLVKKLKEK